MKRLWAPWRMKFVENIPSACVFCDLQNQPDDPTNLVIARGRSAFVLLNRYPYTSGHLLVVANSHLLSLEDLSPAIRAEMIDLATRAMTVLRQVYSPEGFNLGANIGTAAGAGIPGHVHLHVVPRWVGDASFMLTLAETRVLPEDLTTTYQRIATAWNS